MCCSYCDSSSFLLWRLHMRMINMKALTGEGRVDGSTVHQIMCEATGCNNSHLVNLVKGNQF